jgi:o-succinylbenzoate synthase
MVEREGAIVIVTTYDGTRGIGEIAPLPEFGGETLIDACNSFSRETIGLRTRTLERAWEKVPSLSPAAACGLEFALLDLQGKRDECPASTLLSQETPRTAVPVNALIGAQSVEDAFISALVAKQRGFSCVKLKVGNAESSEQEIERIAAVREALGPAVHLRLDANEAWTLEEANAILPHCVPYKIQYVEQPLQRDDVLGMQQLRRTLSLPIAADEAVHDIESARRILRYGAADVLVIKPQLAGGLRASRRIIDEATQRGIQCVLTASIESGITLAATLHLAAASPEVRLECGLATQHLLEDDFILEELFIKAGMMLVPTAHGLGVTLDDEALDTYSPSSYQFSSSGADET